MDWKRLFWFIPGCMGEPLTTSQYQELSRLSAEYRNVVTMPKKNQALLNFETKYNSLSVRYDTSAFHDFLKNAKKDIAPYRRQHAAEKVEKMEKLTHIK